jgi:hypothetical protein
MTEENFIALAKKRYAELQALNKIDNFYNYEKEFETLRLGSCLHEPFTSV